MARKETITADPRHPISKFVSMLIRHRDILEYAVVRDRVAADQVDHEGPTAETMATLAEQRRWRQTPRIWTRLDVQHHQHRAGLRSWGVSRRACRIARRIRSKKPLDVYRAARQKAIEEGDSAVMGPLLKDAWEAYCEYLDAAENDKPLGNLGEGVMGRLNAVTTPLMDELPPPKVEHDCFKDGTERDLGRRILACIDKHGHVVSTPDLLDKMAEVGDVESSGSVSGPLSAMKKAGILKGWSGNRGYTRNT